ncbi:MAG: periplasmic heavy metal sensor [Myxococcota bacterium]
MFGFVFGTVCLMALFALKASAFHRYRRFRHGPGGRRRGRGRGRGMVAFATAEHIKRRLDLDEDQGDLADHAIADAQRSVKEMYGSFSDARVELADLVRGEAVDDAQLEVIFDRIDDDLRRTRREVVSAIKQIHATLDEDQRDRMASLLGGNRDARRV